MQSTSTCRNPSRLVVTLSTIHTCSSSLADLGRSRTPRNSSELNRWPERSIAATCTDNPPFSCSAYNGYHSVSSTGRKTAVLPVRQWPSLSAQTSLASFLTEHRILALSQKEANRSNPAIAGFPKTLLIFSCRVKIGHAVAEWLSVQNGQPRRRGHHSVILTGRVTRVPLADSSRRGDLQGILFFSGRARSGLAILGVKLVNVLDNEALT
jgi:hypothetical protein